MRLGERLRERPTGRWRGSRGGFLRTPAQLLWQRPVHELHWIENTALKNRNVCLTFFPLAVQHTRSLTVSKVFPVGGESGAQASSHRPSTDLEVISESGDGSCRRAGTAVPRCESASSCIALLGTAVPGRNQAWRQRRRQGLESKTLQVPGGRKTNGPRAGRNPAPGHSGRSELPDGLPAANWQAC
jgi:hypothetical protein